MAERLSKAKLSYLRAFHTKKQRSEEGLFLCEGWHLLEEALIASRPIRMLLLEEGRDLNDESRSVFERAASLAESVFLARSDQMDRLLETKVSQGVAFLTDLVSTGWESFEKRSRESEVCRLVALDAVADPGNCGTILRSASWFGLDGAILGEACAELENGKTARSSMGAVFSLPVVQRIALREKLLTLQSEGFVIVETNVNAKDSVFEYEWPKKCVLLVGNEARGVSPSVSDISDTSLLIPRYGKGESLNAAVATAIAMAEWRR